MKVYAASSLTGGTAGSLNYIDVSLLTSGDCAIVFTNSAYYFYVLTDSTASESLPNIVTPQNPSNATKRWFMVKSIFETNTNLVMISNLSPSADTIHYYTSPTTASLTTLTSAGRNFLALVNASGQRTAIGLGGASLRALNAVAPAANTVPYFTGASTASRTALTDAGRQLIGAVDANAQKTLLGLSNVPTTTPAGQTFLNATTTADQRAVLGLSNVATATTVGQTFLNATTVQGQVSALGLTNVATATTVGQTFLNATTVDQQRALLNITDSGTPTPSGGTTTIIQEVVGTSTVEAAHARTLGGTAYEDILGIQSEPTFEMRNGSVPSDLEYSRGVYDYDGMVDSSVVTPNNLYATNKRGTVTTSTSGLRNEVDIDTRKKAFILEGKSTNLCLFSAELSNSVWEHCGRRTI